MPPSVWAEPFDQMTQKAHIAQLESKAPSWNDERLKVYQAFLLASWKLSALLRDPRLGAIALIRESEDRVLLSAYKNCPSPWKEAPESSEINSTVTSLITNVQTALNALFENHVLEIGSVEIETAPEGPLTTPTVESDLNGAICIPATLISHSSTHDSLDSLIASTESAIQSVQRPIHTLLLSKVTHGGIVTNLEVRRWISWLVGLRELSAHTIHLQPNLPSNGGVQAARFSKKVGDKLSLAYRSAKNTLLTLGAAKNDLPRFEPCVGENQTSDFLCLIVPPPSALEQARDRIFHQARERAYDHGKGLEAMRRYSLIMKGVPERAVISLALGNENPELKLPACMGSSDGALMQDVYRESIQTAAKSRATNQFLQALDRVSAKYRDNSLAPPIPKTDEIYTEGHTIALSLFMTALQNQREASGRVASHLDTYNFRDFFHSQRFLDQFPDHLSGKLKLTLAFVNDELSELAPERRTAFLTGHITDTIRYVLHDSLLNFILVVASDLGIDEQAIAAEWERTFGAQWQSILEDPLLRADISQMAETVTAHINTSTTAQPTNTLEWSNQNLRTYVDALSEQAVRAAHADETYRFMESLSEWKNGGESVLSGPQTYYWNRSGIHFSPVELKPERPSDYRHLKEPLKSLAEAHRKALIDRLQSQGFNNEFVRARFALPTTDALADRILAYFDQLVAADPKKFEADRMQQRQQAFQPLLTWLNSPHARAQYDAAAGRLSTEILEADLRPFLEQVPSRESAQFTAWEAQLKAVLKTMSDTKTFRTPPDTETILKVNSRSDNRLRESISNLLREVTERGYFSDLETGLQKCLNEPEKCTSLLKSVQTILTNPALEQLYEWRVISHSLNHGINFLNYFGADGDVYAPPPVASPVPELVISLRAKLNDIWFGFPGSPPKHPSEHPLGLAKEVDALLVALSKSAHVNRTGELDGFHQSLLADFQPTISKTISEMHAFHRWHGHIKSLLPMLTVPVDRLTPALWEQARTLILNELSYLQGVRLPFLNAPSDLDSSRALLLDFSTYRSRLNHLARIVLNQGTDPAEIIHQAEDALRGLRAITKPTEMVQRRIRILGSQLSDAKKDLSAYSELRGLVRHYIPALAESKQALTMDMGSLGLTERWNAYFEDQLLDKNARVTLKDLNSLIAKSQFNQPVEPLDPLNKSTIETILKDSISYFTKLQADPLTESFFHREAIRHRIQGLPDYTLSHVPGNIAGPALFMAGLKVVHARLMPYLMPRGSTNEELYQKFVRASVSTGSATQLDNLIAILPSPREVTTSLLSEAQEILRALNDKNESAQTNFRAFARSLTDLSASRLSTPELSTPELSAPELSTSGFAPFLDSEGTEVSISSTGPHSELAFPKGIDTELSFLNRVISNLSVSHRSSLLSRAGVETPDTKSAAELLNRLSPNDRSRVYRHLLTEVERSISTHASISTNPVAKALFPQGDTQETLSPTWNADLERAIAFYEKKSSLLRKGQTPALTRLIALTLFEYLAPIGFRFSEKQLVQNAKIPIDVSRDQLSQAPTAVLNHFIQDVRYRYYQEVASKSGFSAFSKSTSIDDTNDITKIGPETATLRLLLRRTVIPLSYALAVISAESEALLPFWAKWKPGSTSHLAKDFTEWFSKLASLDSLRSSWGQPNSRGISSRHPSLSSFSKSKEYRHLMVHLVSLDANQTVSDGTGSYPALLAQLNWSINRSGRTFDRTARPIPAPPTFRELDYLVRHLIDVIGIDLKRFDSWRQLLDTHQGAPPELWALASRSLRDSISEVGQGGFLGVKIAAPQSESPHTLFGNHGYIPYPVVNASERELFCATDDLTDWLGRAEQRLHPPHTQWLRFERDASISQKSRLDNEVRGQKEYSLYHEIAQIESDDMVGLQDTIDGNPTIRNRFQSRWDRWNALPFGTAVLPAVELNSLQAQLAKDNISSKQSELERIFRVREALVDFRRTLNEINLQEGVNWWRESRNLFTGDLENQLNLALAQFGKQIATEGWTDRFPRFPQFPMAGRNSKGTFAERRRSSIGSAIFHASRAVHDTLYKGRSPEDTARVRKILGVMDTHFTRSVEVGSVRKTLETTAKNLDETLARLCLADFSAIHSNDDFKRSKDSILASGLPFFDSHQQQLFTDSQMLPSGSQETHNRLITLSQEISDRAKLMKNIEWGFNALMVVSLVALVAGKSSPSLSHWVLATGARRTTAAVAASLVTILWVGIEANGYAEDFHVVPQDLRDKLHIRDSQFSGNNTFLSPQNAAALFDAIRTNDQAQVSGFRWTFRVLAALAGFQLLRPWLKAALGGPGYLQKVIRHDFRGIANSRLRHDLLTLGQGKFPNAIAHLEQLSPMEAQEKVVGAYLAELGATRTGSGVYRISNTTARRLSEDATRQLKQLSKQLGIDPNDFGALSDESLNLLSPKRVMEERAKSLPRLRDLRYWAGRFSGNTTFHQDELMDGVLAIVGVQSSITSRYVPLWLRFFGVEYPTPTSLSLSKLQRLNQAQLDILSYYHPRVRYALAQLSEASGRTIQPWEIFVPSKMASWTAPKPMRMLLGSVKTRAVSASNAFLDRAPYLYESPESRALVSRQLQREVFETALLETGESPIASSLPSEILDQAARLRLEYGRTRFNLLVEEYLIAEGLSLPSHEKTQLELLGQLVGWDASARDLILIHIRSKNPRQSVTETDIQEVIVAMIDPKHPRFAELNRVLPKTESEFHPGTDAPFTETDLIDGPLDLSEHALKLRTILKDYHPDTRLLQAIARSDYSQMASALTARRVAQFTSQTMGTPDAAADTMAEPGGEGSPREPESPVRPSVRPAPKPKMDLASIPPPRNEAEILKERLADLEKGILPTDVREPHRLISKHNLFQVVDRTLLVAHAPSHKNHIVINLFAEGVRPEGIDSALGELITHGLATDEIIAAYRYASDSLRTLEIIAQATEAGVVQPSEKTQLFEWCVKMYLGHPEKLAARAMTPSESASILGLSALRAPQYSAQTVNLAAEKAAGRQINQSFTRQASRAFELTRDGQIQSLRDISDALHFPLEYFDRPELVTGVLHRIVSYNARAERTLAKLYQGAFHDSVEDARVALVLADSKTANITARITDRIRTLREEISGRIELSENRAIHEEAIRRLERAQHILESPEGTFPAKYIAPKVFPDVPRSLTISESSAETTELFNTHWENLMKTLPAERQAELGPLLGALPTQSLSGARRNLWKALGAQQFAFGSPEHHLQRKALRLIHSHFLVEQAKQTGCVVTDAEVTSLFDSLVRHYVERDSIHFELSVDEAEILISASTRLRTSQLEFGKNHERLEEFWKALSLEGHLIGKGEGNISQALHDQLALAAETVKATLYPGKELSIRHFGYYDLETLFLSSYSRLPLEVVIEPEILANRKLVYLFLDGPGVKRASELKTKGDWVIELFTDGAPFSEKLAETAEYQLAQYEIWRRLKWNADLPPGPARDRGQQILEHALGRFGASPKVEPSLPKLERPRRIIVPSENTPKPQRLILPKDFQ